MKKICVLLSLLVLVFTHTPKLKAVDTYPDNGAHYYCTAVDEHYYFFVINLIGSIHKNDFENLGVIAVFDLGLEPHQIAHLQKMQKVKVYPVEKNNPDVLKRFQTDNTGLRLIRGWFAWKPVVFKQALEMFPYMLYCDAGTTILQPLTNVFKHIRQNGYFLLNTGHPIEPRITKAVFEKVLTPLSTANQAMILNHQTLYLDAGLQGLTAALYHEYVDPIYKFASDLTVFMDDGSCKLGFGAARHDQTLFSIYANTLGYTLFDHGWINVTVDGQSTPIHAHWDGGQVNNYTCIYRSRNNLNLPIYEPCIRFNI